MLSMLEGELPRTRGPNPLFWTHTLAHLSLTPQPPATHPVSPPLPRAPYTLVVPTAAFPAFYGTPTPSLTANTAHCPECCVVASPSVPLLPCETPFPLSPKPPSPTVLRVQFCITIRRALRKLPRNFSLPRARPPLSTSCWPTRSRFD